MLIEALLNMVYRLFSLFLSPVNLPDLDSSAQASLDSFFDYLSSGAGLFSLFLPISFGVYFVIWAAIFAWDHLYPFIMWVLRKIPFIGVE